MLLHVSEWLGEWLSDWNKIKGILAKILSIRITARLNKSHNTAMIYGHSPTLVNGHLMKWKQKLQRMLWKRFIMCHWKKKVLQNVTESILNCLAEDWRKSYLRAAWVYNEVLTHKAFRAAMRHMGRINIGEQWSLDIVEYATIYKISPGNTNDGTLPNKLWFKVNNACIRLYDFMWLCWNRDDETYETLYVDDKHLNRTTAEGVSPINLSF